MDTLRGKRLVIFGCGYIGGEVARVALLRGLRVTALTRNPEKAASLRRLGVVVEQGDLAGSDWRARIQGDADFVLNAVSSGGGGVAGYRHSYVEGMRSVMTWARSGQGVGTVVYTSSTSVYPQDHGREVKEEDSVEGAGELPQILVEAEQVLLTATAPGGGVPAHDKRAHIGRAFVFRLAGIYGPERQHLVEQVRAGTVSGKSDHHLNLAHRDDIVRAIWAAFEAPPSVQGGVFNVADDGAARKGEIANWLAEQLGLPPPVFTGAPAAGRRGVTPDRIISNAKLKSVLGWRPLFPTFREGYKNMLALGSD